MSSLSWRRLWALSRKESYQIIRDPSSILMAFVMPVVLLFVFGYAVNLDVNRVHVGLLRLDDGAPAIRLEQAIAGSPAFVVSRFASRAKIDEAIARGDIRGAVIIQNNFSQRWLRGDSDASVQVIADGSQPNSANFVSAYMQGVWQLWQQQQELDRGVERKPLIEIRTRAWYNPGTVSRNFLVPGSIAVVMTIIGAMLTSLVVAREWERGTMEALLATPLTRAELLLAKILPYYLLGLIALMTCQLVAVVIMDVPFRGSLLVLIGISTLFLGCALGLGLFLSTVMRNQFNAAQAALVSGFLPALMLSGFFFEIGSMPAILQFVTHLIPARYFTSSLQTLFQAGVIPSILVTNALFLLFWMIFWLTMTAGKTRRTLD